jgi:hypothetical protein
VAQEVAEKEDSISATGLDLFDKTLQTTNVWLDEIMAEMGPDRQVAWHVLGAVLHALQDRMQPDLAAHLGSQLPRRGSSASGVKWRRNLGGFGRNAPWEVQMPLTLVNPETELVATPRKTGLMPGRVGHRFSTVLPAQAVFEPDRG